MWRTIYSGPISGSSQEHPRPHSNPKPGVSTWFGRPPRFPPPRRWPQRIRGASLRDIQMASHRLWAGALLLSLLSPIANAFVFPKGLPDGVYKIPIDDKGNALRGPIFLDGLNTTGGSGRPWAPPPLPRSQLACGRNRVDKGALDHVKELFENMCEEGRKFDPGTAVIISTFPFSPRSQLPRASADATVTQHTKVWRRTCAHIRHGTPAGAGSITRRRAASTPCAERASWARPTCQTTSSRTGETASTPSGISAGRPERLGV